RVRIFYSFTQSLSLHHSLSATPDLHSFPTRRSSDLLRNTLFVERLHNITGVVFNCPPLSGRIHIVPKSPEIYNNTAKLFLELRRSEEHTSELQSRFDLVCRLLLEKKIIHTSYVETTN